MTSIEYIVSNDDEKLNIYKTSRKDGRIDNGGPIHKDAFKTYGRCLQIMKAEHGGIFLMLVPKQFRDHNLCLEAVKTGGELQSVPEEHRSREMCLLVFSSCSQRRTYGELQHVPEALLKSEQGLEICATAVAQCGSNLVYVPEEYTSYGLCLVAMKTYPDAIRDMDIAFRTYELCYKAIESEFRFNSGLGFIPEHLQSKTLYLFAVEKDEHYIKNVPESVLDEDICLTAVRKGGWVLEYVPDKYKTSTVCLEAVKQNKWALKHVPKTLENYEAIQALGRVETD